MRKHFIDPKSSEILSIFQVFPCTTQIALFWPKLLPAEADSAYRSPERKCLSGRGDDSISFSFHFNPAF
jgi:hypothetical protein